MLTWMDLKVYLNVSDLGENDFIKDCWDDGYSLVYDFCEYEDVPGSIIERAALLVGANLYWLRNAPGGVTQFASFDGAPVRVQRDPMQAALPLLRRYMVVGL